jgi:hypothetical protein
MNAKIPADVLADRRAVTESIVSGRPLDPVIRERILERSKRVQEELLRTYGVREIAVDLIRETRDE